MMGPQNSALTMEGSTFAARGYSNSNYDNRQKKGRPWCDHCNKPGHVKENCWKIHGKPADWKPSKSITKLGLFVAGFLVLLPMMLFQIAKS